MSNTKELQSIVFICLGIVMLTTLHSNELANYAAVFKSEIQLLSFVSLAPEATYFFVCYGGHDQRSPGSTALLWRPHDVIELVDYINEKPGEKISQFSALKYASTESGPRLVYQNINEFWVSRDQDDQSFVFSYVTEDGVSHMGHTCAPSDSIFGALLRVF